MKFNRDEMINAVSNTNTLWDIVVIGGGATGAGVALDAASRGFKTLLVEQNDFGKGTSSRSTKLIHGGVRYLQQGNFSLVMEALKERGILYKNAPHLVGNLKFVVPRYDWWEGTFYGIGLKLYDMMAGKYGFGESRLLDVAGTMSLIPTIETKNLRGGIIYYDGQFDDSRLLINILQTAVEHGAAVLNYFKMMEFIKSQDLIEGIIAEDIETGIQYEIKAKAVVNATGIFSDNIRKLENFGEPELIEPSRGTHIVLDKSFLPGDTAIMVPNTDDGRVLFAIPWHDKVIVGTTDIPVDKPELEPKASEEEIEFLLKHIARYLTNDPSKDDIRSVFAGLRPLVKSGDEKNTAAISREHTINISRSGLITIAGGKWTTFRKMAEDTVNTTIELAGLENKKSVTENLRIHGYTTKNTALPGFEIYGSDADDVQIICNANNLYDLLHPSLPIHKGEVIWAVRNEMARTVEDFLARRRRALFLDAKASMEAAPVVAHLMAKELNKNNKWEEEQMEKFNRVALNYLP